MGSRGNQVDMFVRSERDADALMDRVRQLAQQVRGWIAVQRGDSLDMLQRIKFEPVGFHPIEGYALNLIEQVNQTWTYAVAIAASKQLLRLHPDVGGFHLAPGPYPSRASLHPEAGDCRRTRRQNRPLAGACRGRRRHSGANFEESCFAV